MRIILKTGDPHPLNPTNVSHGKYTILQRALLRLFPNTTQDHFRLARTRPGEEISDFQQLLSRERKSPLILRDDRGNGIPIDPGMDLIHPPEEFLLAIIRNLAISYEEGSRRSESLRNAILNTDIGTQILYIHSSQTSQTSFLYDGHKREGSGKYVQVRGAHLIIMKAIERAREAIESEETMALDVLTPTEAQEDLVNLLMKLSRTRVNEHEGDWGMNVDGMIDLPKMYARAFNVNRGFLRATHPSMLLPDDSPNHIIRHIENVGKSIARTRNIKDREFFGESVPSVEMREYIEKEDRVSTSTTILPIEKANPFEMKSLFRFDRMRPILRTLT
jgi:hypothetical protein